MSRSHKRHPVLKDGGHSHKEGKRATSRRARRTSAVLPAKGNHAHRYLDDRLVESRSYMTKRDAERIWDEEEMEYGDGGYLHFVFKTKERWLLWWRKRYLGK